MKQNYSEHILSILSVLPDSPGVYQYYDKDGAIIYIGKAKNLKKRVSSYFNKIHDSAKTNVLVKNIVDIRYIVVGSEEDALHLESSMIKEYKPRYNVLLKDDKSYPYIVVTNEPYPRIFLTRKVLKNGSKYYGPYSNVHLAKMMIELIRSIYPLRTCQHLLTPDTIAKGKISLCLQYHIKNCKGICRGLESQTDYMKYISGVHDILSGETARLCTYLREEMDRLAEKMEFEEAQLIKEKYLLLDSYHARSLIVNSTISQVDVFSFDENEQAAFINCIHLHKGAIIRSFTIEYKKRLDETKEDLLVLGIEELRTRFNSNAKEIIIPFPIELPIAGVTCTIPLRGDKKKLLDISQRNVKQYKLDLMKQAEKLNPDQRMMRILSRLQRDLNLKELPLHIECFDNSNIQGEFPVAACVVFKKAKPAKKDYRHFAIKTVVGPDDFASMYEVVTRRYTRLVEEASPLPQLIIVDGGKGQLNAAVAALHDVGIASKVAIIGVAKRLEEIYFPHDSVPLYLDKNSEGLKLIQQLRDEAHRFGITFHRSKRSKAQVLSQLDSIAGIGEKSREELLAHFKSVKRIAAANEVELAAIIGKHRAAIVKAALLENKNK